MKKQHILDEIKRTAAANGGKPLGRERFTKETGIREADWAGRYWVRWNDAVAEAGLAPNALNTAYEDERMLAQLAAYTAELGAVPVKNEMRMRKRSDPDYPNEKSFARFGTKQELIARLLAYAQARGLAEVVAVCTPLVDGAAEPEEDEGDEPENGSVYLIKSGRHYKVGRSNAAGRREYEIALQLPEKAKTVHVITTDDPPGIEAYWHKRFAARRLNGEWFDLDAADVRAFRRRKFM